MSKKINDPDQPRAHRPPSSEDSRKRAWQKPSPAASGKVADRAHADMRPVRESEKTPRNSVWPDPKTFVPGNRAARGPSVGARSGEPYDRPAGAASERAAPNSFRRRDDAPQARDPEPAERASAYSAAYSAPALLLAARRESSNDSAVLRQGGPSSPAGAAPAQRRSEEMRIYGRNACLAVFARRRDDVRKVYLLENLIPAFKEVLAWCVQNRLGYRVVETQDLERLTESQHHEGICFDVRHTDAVSIGALLDSAAEQESALLVWLDGVANPHNVGAMLRSAANFGALGVIVSTGTSQLSGAAMRVAEGGTEAVPIALAQAGENVAQLLRSAGFSIAATVPRDGIQLYTSELPCKLALIFGAEGEGMSASLIRDADMRLTIPGTGAVESLNVAASAAVLFAEFWRQWHKR